MCYTYASTSSTVYMARLYYNIYAHLLCVFIYMFAHYLYQNIITILLFDMHVIYIYISYLYYGNWAHQQNIKWAKSCSLLSTKSSINTHLNYTLLSVYERFLFFFSFLFFCSKMGWRFGLQIVAVIVSSSFFMGLLYRSASLYHPQRRAILHLKNQRKKVINLKITKSCKEKYKITYRNGMFMDFNACTKWNGRKWERRQMRKKS